MKLLLPERWIFGTVIEVGNAGPRPFGMDFAPGASMTMVGDKALLGDETAETADVRSGKGEVRSVTGEVGDIAVMPDISDMVELRSGIPGI